MKIKPYGDSLNDGRVQVSFTLPLASDELGEAAALKCATLMGLSDPSVVHQEALSSAFSFYVVYGSMNALVDTDDLTIIKHDHESMSKERVEAYIKTHFKEDLVFIGASTGTDAHTVGIDAIMNMKGFAGHYGLERYKGIKAINLGSQVDNERLLEEAIKHQADVILISQTVTQKDVHIKNLTHFIELIEAENVRNDFILIIGGPRINHALAKELGYDAGFGPAHYAFDVASFAVTRLKALGIKTK